MFRLKHIPTKPFKDFKWQWASFQCTEGINDPVVLLGVLFRMAKLENKGLKYSSNEFADELRGLADDLNNSGVDVDIRRRVGERNIIRNSGQYWKALNLIPSDTRDGQIRLTPFGRHVADHTISQAEFAAATIATLTLPNPYIQSENVCNEWKRKDLQIMPLKLILSILSEMKKIQSNQKSWITSDELVKVVIPLSGEKISPIDISRYIMAYREGRIPIDEWPECAPKSNDRRMAREFLLFLTYYGYLEMEKNNNTELFYYNDLLNKEIEAIISVDKSSTKKGLNTVIKIFRSSDVVSEVERKRYQRNQVRPNQARFRAEVLGACKRCVITNVTMPEVLEAAHIKPYKYKGEDTVANGFAMRTDMHILFDTGHLRIDTQGNVVVSGRAKMDYGATIPPIINIPDFINKDFIQWRWDNYNGI